MPRSTADYIDGINQTFGFLTTQAQINEPVDRRERPVYVPLDPRNPDHIFDHQKILAGYACSECLADFGTTYRLTCPVCGYTRDALSDVYVTPPPEWVEYLRYRKEQLENPVATPVIDMDATLRRVMGDPDVEHTTLSKLKKRRK